MFRATISLQNPDTSFRQLITPGEARRREAAGEIFRISAKKSHSTVYRIRERAAASNSKESPACLTMADLEAIAGIRQTTEQRRERLIGWGLLKEKVAEFDTRTRALYFEEFEPQVANA